MAQTIALEGIISCSVFHFHENDLIFRFHELRHFFATYLLENNLSKQVAADLLGHADTAFLERTYCHPRNEAKQRAANILNDLLAPEEEAAWEREQAEERRRKVG